MKPFEALKNLPMQFPNYDISFTFDIIDSLIRQTEAAIEASISDFHTKGPEIEEFEIDAAENAYHVAEHYMGLDSGSVVLEDMFTSYYPSITRRSVFLTLYGMLEHDFENLCNRFTRSHNAPVKLSDLRGSGFERCDLYARRIIGMQTSKHYPSVKQVTKLRNACAHNDARFVTNENKEIRELIALMDTYSTEFVRDDKQINFKAGSLQAMTNILKNYFSDVREALEAHDLPDPFEVFRQQSSGQ